MAQDDPIPLGDVARSLRAKSIAIPETVIDNDNLSQVVDDAESRREAGLLPVFSLDPGYNSFHVSSPDVSCSLSFTATNVSVSDQFLLTELPSTELPKLDGPATIDGDTLQVTVQNGTSWELREVVIGLTIIRSRNSAPLAANDANRNEVHGPGENSGVGSDPFQKKADTTILLRVKGFAAPAATAIFRTSLNFALFPDQEWHWAIVKAKGIPPQAAPVATAATSIAAPEQVNPLLSLQPKQSAIVGIAPAVATPANADVQPQ